ncbi:MAG: methylase of chemotaxis methyl-accepting protein, partial [Lacunisphaera sp.]|nr:methylase of chemotaxis methyl-accepting protein [Lacunisphaera sp.]
RYDSMPCSAVAAGCVDSVLSPARIARELARIARHPYVAGRIAVRSSHAVNGKSAAEPAGRTEADGYRKILLLLRNHTGVDFSHYKSSTVLRRMSRRAVLNHRGSLRSYADFLRGNARELDALYSDSLINVTSFFRNADAFAVLKAKVLAKLLASRSHDPLRIWVLGCSTGQEAYSIAMLFTEAAAKSHRPRKLQVFATDLNEANLVKARHGLYPKSALSDISPERLRRFFVAEEGGYRVIKALREQVVFARHNIISDPPFSRMDLITCRNLLIYFAPSLQKKVLPAFHYALKPEGCLFLGASESVGGFTDLFSLVDKRQKIFSKKAAPTLAFALPVRSEFGPRPGAVRAPVLTGRGHGGAAEVFRGELNAEREADRVTVNQFAPPSVLIDDDLQILQFRGSTGMYLEPPTGKAQFGLLKMARDGLMLPLRAAINRAKKDHQTVRKASVPFVLDGKNRVVHLEVVPLKNLKERRYLVMFEDPDKRGHPLPAEEAAPSAPPASKREEASRISGLEQDLAETRDYLQSIQEHQESANEELQASNEEGQSANEELQSLNEELETSKEELESTNEELTTVNEEMVTRNTELNRLNGDLTNLQTSTKLAILLLGRDLTIRRFSVQAEKQFNLRAGDLGRSLGGVRHNLELPDLEALVTEVIHTVQECEREVQARDGRWYSLRVRPYLALDNKVDGAVLVLVDIDAVKKAEQEVTHARDFAEAVIGTVRDPLLILDHEFRVHLANEAFLSTFRLSSPDVLGRRFFELAQGQWKDDRLRALLRKILPGRTFFDNFQVTQNFRTIGRRTFLLNARTLSQAPGHREKILLGLQDVTELRDAQDQTRKSELRYRRLFEAAQDGILIVDPATRKITDANPFVVRLLGYPRAQLLKKELWQIGLLRDEAASRKAFAELKRKGFIRYEDLPLKSKDGTHHEVEFVSNLYEEDGVNVIQCNIRDITQRKRTERALGEVQAKLAEHAGQLETLVTKRTAQLSKRTAELEESLHTVRQGEVENREHLVESQHMQVKLRRLTHQILTAQEEERKKISRELHDEVVQTLVGINVELSALVHGNSPGVQHLKDKIAHTQRLVENSVDAVHRFARELRPAVLDDLGLIPALEAYGKSLAARKKLKIHLTATRGVETLHSDKRTVLFRVAQEALTNVARHARATVVRLTISKIPGGIRMEVADNGKSFPVRKTLRAKSNKRLGLVGMRERVEMVGGTLVIESLPGRGTTVCAELPFGSEKIKK